MEYKATSISKFVLVNEWFQHSCVTTYSSGICKLADLQNIFTSIRKISKLHLAGWKMSNAIQSELTSCWIFKPTYSCISLAASLSALFLIPMSMILHFLERTTRQLHQFRKPQYHTKTETCLFVFCFFLFFVSSISFQCLICLILQIAILWAPSLREEIFKISSVSQIFFAGHISVT